MTNDRSTGIHSFSRKLAQEHGVTGAILLGYVGNRIANSKQTHAGKTWYFDSLDGLAKHYPYFSRSVIHETLQSLATKTGPLIKGNFNKNSYDRTTWYAFRDDQAQRHLAAEPLYFRADEAERHGVLAAVLLNNLRHWIRKNRETDPRYRFHPLSPTKLAEILPFSESAIKRALKYLASDEPGVLLFQRRSGGRDASEYAFADEKGLALIEESGGSFPDGAGGPFPDTKMHIPDMCGPNPDGNGPNQDMCGSIPDARGSNPDNNTILIETCLKAPCLKESLKERSFQSGSDFDELSSNAVLHQNGVSTATSIEHGNPLEETVDGKPGVAVEPKAFAGSCSVPSSSSKSAPPLSPPSPTLIKPLPPKPAHLLFLDEEVDGKNTELAMTLSSLMNTEDMRLKIADLVVEVIGEMVRPIKAEDLMHFLGHRINASPKKAKG